jgi:hypothetical protein
LDTYRVNPDSEPCRRDAGGIWPARTGTNRPLALEVPPVRCADDAEAALNIVIEAFGRGAITVHEFSPMLGAPAASSGIPRRPRPTGREARHAISGEFSPLRQFGALLAYLKELH